MVIFVYVRVCVCAMDSTMNQFINCRLKMYIRFLERCVSVLQGAEGYVRACENVSQNIFCIHSEW